MAEAYKRLFLYAAGYDSTVLNHVDDASSLLKLARLITDDKQLAPDTSNSSSIAATWQTNNWRQTHQTRAPLLPPGNIMVGLAQKYQYQYH